MRGEGEKEEVLCMVHTVSVLQERVLETITQRCVPNVKMHALCFHWFFLETGSLYFKLCLAMQLRMASNP